MRNPENVLISLTKHSNQKDYKYERWSYVKKKYKLNVTNFPFL